jgi:type I restriction-modification system DNA methylase subunit
MALHEQAHDTRVTVSQIAELAQVNASAVSNWRKRFEDFPEPAGTLAGGREVFFLREVEDWLRDHDKLPSERRVSTVLWQVTELLRDRLSADETVEFLCSVVAFVHLRESQSAAPVSISGFNAWPEVEEVEIASSEHGLFDALGRVPHDVLTESVLLMSQIPAAQRADLFESILEKQSRFVAWSSAPAVTRLIVKLSMNGASSVLDPAAGTGGFLLAAARTAKKPLVVRGQEINLSAWRIAKQRLLIHRVEAVLRQGDSLSSDAFSNEEFDVVLCDPPYGAKPKMEHLDADARWSFGLPVRQSTDFLWLQHAIHHLADKGRAYVLLPKGSLFRHGLESQIRQEMVRRGAVEAVIALPSGSAQHTTLELSLWILRPPDSQGGPRPILFVDASTDQSVRQGLNEQLITRIVGAVKAWRLDGDGATEKGFSAGIRVLDLLGPEADLTPARWVREELEVSPVQQAKTAAAAVERLKRAEKALVPTKWAIRVAPISESIRQWTPIRDLVVRDVAQVIKGIVVRPDDYVDSGTRALRTRDIRDGFISDEEPHYVALDNAKRKVQLTESGDVVVSPGGGKPKAAVDERGGRVVVAPLQVLRFQKEWLDPYLAASFIASERNRRFVQGIAYARVNVQDLELPVLSPEEAQKLRTVLEELVEVEHKGRELADAAGALRSTLLKLAIYRESAETDDD